MEEKLRDFLDVVQPWGERAMDIALGEPVGHVPVPSWIDFLASHVSDALSSPRFPLHLNNVNLDDIALARAIVVIALAPLIWNVIARFEFYTRAISRLVGRTIGAYALALWIFSFSIYRDLLFLVALESQPRLSQMQEPGFVLGGAALYGIGIILVITSMFRLGITGTYLGDYFGILMDEKVTAFPYNWFENPMYDGATACFLGKALLFNLWLTYVLACVLCMMSLLTMLWFPLCSEESPAGVLLSTWVFLVYQVATSFEEPFTYRIYGLETEETEEDSGKKEN